jgi:hypothetical protein
LDLNMGAGAVDDDDLGEHGAAALLSRADGLRTPERWTELVNGGAGLQRRGLLSDAENVLGVVVSETRNAADDAVGAGDALSGALVNLATVAIARGASTDLERAESLLTEASQIAAALSKHARLGTIEVNRARIFSLRGEVAEARRALERAKGHYIAADSPGDLAWTKRALGASLAAAGQLGEALRLQLQAREEFRGAGDGEQADATEVGILALRAELGEMVTAQEQARLLRLSTTLSAEAAHQLLGNLANVAMRDGELDQAERLWVSVRDRGHADGRLLDAARAELFLAGATRRRGDLALALEQTLAAGARLAELGAWEPAARAQVNAALILGTLADTDGENAAKLRHEAAARIAEAVDALDRLRHALPDASARRALLRVRYPQLFVAALEAAIGAGQPDLVAALVERSRMQPVLSGEDAALGRFLEPPRLAARSGAPELGGVAPAIHLTSVTEVLAGADALWLGWWRADAELVCVNVSSSDTAVRTVELALSARTDLDRWLPRPTADEQKLAEEDHALAGRLALLRAARAPLLCDDRLVARLQRTVPPRLRARTTVRPSARALDDTLWPLSRALLGDALLAELRQPQRGRRNLVIAPPPSLADVPWPLLPLSDPADGALAQQLPRLIDAAEITIGLPAALVSHRRLPAHRPTGGVLAVLDPIGDLPHARHLPVDAHRLGWGAEQPATPANLRAALAQPVELLILAAHVRPGVPDDPAAAALLLADGAGGVAELTVRELGAVTAPAVCVILGCDGSGGTVGEEWTGIATALIWAGAEWVITSTWPTIEDSHTAAGDSELIAAVQAMGPRAGLWSWQRRLLERWRAQPGDPGSSPYRWAGTVVCGAPYS